VSDDAASPSGRLEIGAVFVETPRPVDDPGGGVNHRYATLDGLRGLAAFAVMLLHLGPGGPPNAYLAVDFFFALSGFVVAHAYENRLKSGGMGLLAFVRTRVLRLYPLALLGVVLGALSLIGLRAEIDDQLRGFVAGALLLPTWSLSEISRFAFPGDPPLWSLFFELAINVAYAFAIPFLGTRRLAALTALFGGVVVWAAVANHGLDVGWRLTDFFLGTARVLFPFSCGVLLRRFPLAPLNGGWLWPIAAVLLAVLFCPLPQGAPLAIGAILAVFPAMVAVGAAVRTGPNMSRVLGYLGGLSYPVYVLHNPIFRIVRRSAAEFGLQAAWLPAASVVLVLAVSHVAMSLYDEPVRAWLSRRFAPRREPQPLAEAA
jgi:peptidoglycan/LPS O-acetylase OafA/YrhL